MSMPFNVIYQAAYDREDEIRKDANSDRHESNREQSRGRIASVFQSWLGRPAKQRSYKVNTCAVEQTAK